MNTFAINTLGCKVNQYESQQIRQFIEQFGLRYTERLEAADLIAVHTCCVTANASAKSRQFIRKARKLNPKAAIVITGCLLQIPQEQISATDKNIHFIKSLTLLTHKLPKIIKNSSNISSDNTDNCFTKKNLPKFDLLHSFAGHSRAFVKIQDGCDGFCSYCIVPKTRKTITSKPAPDVIKEIQALVNAGHKEIVLSGVFLGAYRQTTVKRKHWQPDKKNALPDLLDKAAQIPNLKRIRLSSIEPADITDELLAVFRKHKNIAPHLHLPLQSGSQRILKKMCRQYTVADFRNSIEKLNLRLDRPAITTDIIVGFPGETDQDFQQTLQLADEVGFAKMHVFPFSVRTGTAAEKMMPRVDSKVIKERTGRLNDLGKLLQHKFRKQFANEIADVLIEDERLAKGRTGRYFDLKIIDGTVRRNDFVRVRICSDGTTARLI